MTNSIGILNSDFNNFPNKKLLIENLSFYDDNLHLHLKENLFLFKDDIKCTLKNIKTRTEYNCPIKVNNTCLEISLLSLQENFTDYEGLIYISIQKELNIYNFLPIIITTDFTPIKQTNSDNLYWYIRILENGEFRLSSITKK